MEISYRNAVRHSVFVSCPFLYISTSRPPSDVAFFMMFVRLLLCISFHLFVFLRSLAYFCALSPLTQHHNIIWNSHLFHSRFHDQKCAFIKARNKLPTASKGADCSWLIVLGNVCWEPFWLAPHHRQRHKTPSSSFSLLIYARSRKSLIKLRTNRIPTKWRKYEFLSRKMQRKRANRD